MKSKLKIAFIVHGRFDAFDLVRELIKKGQDVTLFTNYPKWAVKQFGIAPAHVKSFLLHGLISRTLWFLHDRFRIPFSEAYIHKMFGEWAAKEITKDSWDVIHSWSGVSEEVLKASAGKKSVRILMRGSSHINMQAKILGDEEKRVNMSLSKPSAWMIEREKKEYELTDYIRVLSRFAYDSFLKEGIRKEKLLLISSGTAVEEFRTVQRTAEERYKRILEKNPLRVLYVGTLSFRKGMWDMEAVVSELKKDNFKFKLVGPKARETRKFLKKLKGKVDFISKQPQRSLVKWYSWADLFFFPTVEDGYAVVLSQAQASGLPIVTTGSSAGPDIIVEGKTGWVIPARSSGKFTERLKWCNSHRNELAEMSMRVYQEYLPKDWPQIAEDFINSCKYVLKAKNNL